MSSNEYLRYWDQRDGDEMVMFCHFYTLFHRKREAWYAIYVRQVNNSKLKVIKNIFNMQPYANILHVILLLAAPSLGEYEVVITYTYRSCISFAGGNPRRPAANSDCSVE